MKTGSCLCGGVSFELRGPLDSVIACHCNQCRKQTGNYWASTHTADKDLAMLKSDTLAWYRASESARRGFCSACGSTLFWKKDGSDVTSVCAGSIDGKTDLKLAGHIYVADAGDYYEIAGGDYRLPQS
ncbi:MAG: GFA family protein [Aestuariivirga sp.]